MRGANQGGYEAALASVNGLPAGPPPGRLVHDCRRTASTPLTQACVDDRDGQVVVAGKRPGKARHRVRGGKSAKRGAPGSCGMRAVRAAKLTA